MAEGHGWGGASRADSNHPALTSISMSPCYNMCIPLTMARRLTLCLQRPSQKPV
jgi:hypothetical protein